MSGEQLIDIDELMLRCKDKDARDHVREAVACYKVGAFRSCIVATWTAVVFDFLHKLRQLELTGDKNAKAKLEEFEDIRNSNNPGAALKFEDRVLGMCKDEFEFLSNLEYEDLLRLKYDRNRCAHPSMISADEPYQPSGELARTHLRNAVTHMLQHPPVQGKAALDRLRRDLMSGYFPTTIDDAIEFLRHGPLPNSRDSLVRNLAIVLLKEILFEELGEYTVLQRLAAFAATRELHPVLINEVLSERLSELIVSLEDDKVKNALRILESMEDVMQYVRGDSVIRISNYISVLGSSEIRFLLFTLNITDLRKSSLQRLRSASVDEMAFLAKENPREEFIEPTLLLYAGASTLSTANPLGVVLQLLTPVLTRHHVEQIFDSIEANFVVRRSLNMKATLKTLQEAQIIPSDDFDKLLHRSGVYSEFYDTEPERDPSDVDELPF
jgi:hypothetical protein